MQQLKKYSKHEGIKLEMLKSDGNGGFVIQKGTFALIMVVIALLSCVATVVAYGATIKADVTFLKEEYRQGSIDHPKVVDEIRTQIEENQDQIIHNQEKIIAMADDVREIKTDVKELL